MATHETTQGRRAGWRQWRPDDEVLSVVRQLVARNEELERRLGGKGKANEGVSSQQLQLVLEEFQKAEERGETGRG